MHALMHHIDNAQHAADCACLPPARLARTLSLQGKNAGAWLLAAPENAHLSLSDAHFTYAMRYRFGVPHTQGVTSCPLCKKHIDPTDANIHAMCCVKARRKARNVQHNDLVQLGATHTRRAGLAVAVEKSPDDGNRLRPDSHVFFPSQPLMTDHTVREPSAPSLIKNGSVRAGQAIRSAVSSKHSKYDALAKAEHSSFAALALETHGRFHPEFRLFLKRISTMARVNCRIQDTPEAATQFLVRAVNETSVCLQRGNAKVLIKAAANFKRTRAREARRRRGAFHAAG
jgi:hypothetical protein